MVVKAKKCSNCGYYGPVNCIEALGHTGETCICPKCDFTISQMRKNIRN